MTDPEGPRYRKARELMNITLWIIAGLLAAVFLLAGVNKLFIPQEKLAKAPVAGDGSWEQSRSWAPSA
jgi:hypothetical protein